MIARTLSTAVAALIFCVSVSAQEKPATPTYFEQEVKDSNPLRTEQAKELDEYILALKQDNARLRKMVPNDYSSPQAFEKSAQRYRQAFCDSIGYPPPGDVPPVAATFKQIGEDGIGTYFRAMIPILPGVHAEGIYIVPKSLKTGEKAPLVISMHGGGGSPEVALFKGGANYHDMVRGGIKRGYVVFAPQHLFSAEGYPKDVRNRTDERLRLVGTSLTAVEIAKISRSLDVLLKRPEVDASRVAMVGLSYGGYYALVTPAIRANILSREQPFDLLTRRASGHTRYEFVAEAQRTMAYSENQCDEKRQYPPKARVVIRHWRSLSCQWLLASDRPSAL